MSRPWRLLMTSGNERNAHAQTDAPSPRVVFEHALYIEQHFPQFNCPSRLADRLKGFARLADCITGTANVADDCLHGVSQLPYIDTFSVQEAPRGLAVVQYRPQWLV